MTHTFSWCCREIFPNHTASQAILCFIKSHKNMQQSSGAVDKTSARPLNLIKAALKNAIWSIFAPACIRTNVTHHCHNRHNQDCYAKFSAAIFRCNPRVLCFVSNGLFVDRSWTWSWNRFGLSRSKTEVAIVTLSLSMSLRPSIHSRLVSHGRIGWLQSLTFSSQTQRCSCLHTGHMIQFSKPPLRTRKCTLVI